MDERSRLTYERHGIGSVDQNVARSHGIVLSFRFIDADVSLHKTDVIEPRFLHQFDTGGMDRLWVRGKDNVSKKVLIQAAACNLALLMRSLYGAGKPKAAHDRIQSAILAT